MTDVRRVVLVVDDETLTREVLGVLLESDEIEVHTAGSGTEAIEAARELRPDVVVLDIMMPGLDGFTVCRSLRAEPATAGARIVMLSARDDRAAWDDARRAGADAFLTKPYGARELFAAVEGDATRAP